MVCICDLQHSLRFVVYKLVLSSRGLNTLLLFWAGLSMACKDYCMISFSPACSALCCNISPGHTRGLYFLPLSNPSKAGSLWICHSIQLWQSFRPPLLSKDGLLENTAKVLNPPYEFRDKYIYLWRKNPVM